ncbi:MAG: acyl carrier protein [Clostridia bacterium]|nr:acyl carrier protein [Clostridia bacterium]
MMGTFEKVKELLVEKLGLDADKVTPASEIIKDLGADSLDLVEMLFALEEEFGVTVPEDKTESIVTVQDIVDIIDSAK